MPARDVSRTAVVVHHRSQPVVLVSDHPEDPLSPDQVHVMLAEAREFGWRLLDFDQAQPTLREQPPIGMLVNWVAKQAVAQAIGRLGCPAVRLGRLPLPEDQTMPAVLPDFADAGRLGADYFANRGFKTLGLVGHARMQIFPPIDQGFRERAEAHGCEYHSFQFLSGTRPPLRDMNSQQRRAHRRQQLTQWLAELPKPAAILGCTPEYSSMVAANCQQLGLAVPEDIAVLALGDEPIACELSPVSISAINQNRRSMSRMAVHLLNDLIQGKPVPPRTYIPPRNIVTRRSTDILSVENPQVVRTVRFIWDHFDRDMSVDDIARQMHVSRPKLERLFRQHFPRGINAELRRVRLEKFKQLLRATNHPIRELAPMVGFHSSKYLHKTFRKEFGITPRQFRLKSRQDRGRSAETEL